MMKFTISQTLIDQLNADKDALVQARDHHAAFGKAIAENTEARDQAKRTLHDIGVKLNELDGDAAVARALGTPNADTERNAEKVRVQARHVEDEIQKHDRQIAALEARVVNAENDLLVAKYNYDLALSEVRDAFAEAFDEAIRTAFEATAPLLAIGFALDEVGVGGVIPRWFDEMNIPAFLSGRPPIWRDRFIGQADGGALDLRELSRTDPEANAVRDLVWPAASLATPMRQLCAKIQEHRRRADELAERARLAAEPRPKFVRDIHSELPQHLQPVRIAPLPPPTRNYAPDIHRELGTPAPAAPSTAQGAGDAA